MKKTGLRIPISAASAIGKEHGYNKIVVFAFDDVTGVQSVCTWGQTGDDCEDAAFLGNKVKEALGWPDSYCHLKPSRQIKRENFQTENKKLLVLHQKLIEEIEELNAEIHTLQND